MTERFKHHHIYIKQGHISLSDDFFHVFIYVEDDTRKFFVPFFHLEMVDYIVSSTRKTIYTHPYDSLEHAFYFSNQNFFMQFVEQFGSILSVKNVDQAKRCQNIEELMRLYDTKALKAYPPPVPVPTRRHEYVEVTSLDAFEPHIQKYREICRQHNYPAPGELEDQNLRRFILSYLAVFLRKYPKTLFPLPSQNL